jgi:hypothetical protein
MGLATCFPATSDAEKISFNQINKKTGHRVRYLTVDARPARKSPTNIIKRYKVDTDTNLEVSKDELENIALESTRTIEIDEFVPSKRDRRPLHCRLKAFDPAGFSNVSESDLFGKIYDDHIRTISLASDYRLQDALGGLNDATLVYRQGLDIFGASQIGDDFVSRYGANANFSVLNFAYTRYQELVGPWSAKLSMASQTASGPLFTSQQFYLGGAAFGRGYGAAEISGDNGIAGSFELRFDQQAHVSYPLSRLQFYAFTDSGVVWNDGYHPWDGLSLISVGGGIRLFFGDDLQADIAVAFPLSYCAPENSERSARLLFSVSNALKL